MATLDQTQNFVPTRTDEGNTIYGKVEFAAPRGKFVNYKANSAASNGAFNERELQLATGGSGFYLARNVVAANEANRLQDFVQGTQEFYANNWIVDESTCSAHKADEAVLEGTDLIDAGITGATAAGTKLMFSAGKVAIHDEAVTKNMCGELAQQLTPTNGGATRIRVIFY